MRRKAVGFLTLSLLILIAAPFLLTWREVRQERLDRTLIALIKPATQNYNDEADSKAAQELLSQGADPNARDTLAAPPRSVWQALLDRLRGKTRAFPPGPTCLQMALLTWEYNEDKGEWNAGDMFDNTTRLAKVLLENGADPNVRESPRDPASDTLLINACGGYEGGVVARLLVEHGANVNLRGKFEIPALLLAAHANDTDTVRLLVQHGAEVNFADPDTGWTALWYAVSNSNREMLQILLTAHADPNVKDRAGETPLTYAHSFKAPHSDDIVALLTAAGARE